MMVGRSSRLEVERKDSVVSVKNRIKAEYRADTINTRAVFLFGHVPVAYSGDIVPDGHVPDHQGAWPSGRLLRRYGWSVDRQFGYGRHRR